MLTALLRRFFPFVALPALAFFWWLMLGIVAPYASGKTDLDFLLSKQRVIRFDYYRWSFYLHIFSSLYILAAGATQFSGWILKNSPRIHRLVGQMYTGAILCISGPAALIMAFYANGGPWAKASFITLSIAWWMCTWLGWKAIRRGDVRAHGAWMIRSYALTLSAITLRSMQYVLVLYSSIPPEESYTLVAWPSWVLNWLIAEWIVSRNGWLKAVYR
jgi:uncharacterized membrane protein